MRRNLNGLRKSPFPYQDTREKDLQAWVKKLGLQGLCDVGKNNCFLFCPQRFTRKGKPSVEKKLITVSKTRIKDVLQPWRGVTSIIRDS